jgi:hypothetical protein
VPEADIAPSSATWPIEVVETLTDAAVRQRFIELGQKPWPRDKQTPEELATQQKIKPNRRKSVSKRFRKAKRELS